MKQSILWAGLALAGCGATGAREVAPPSTISVPIAVGCVSGARPDAVTPLSAQYGPEQWRAFSPKQKAEIVTAQALKHQSRAEGIDAATGACK